MSEVNIVKIRSTIDFVPMIEAQRRVADAAKLALARAVGERAFVATGHDGVTRVRLLPGGAVESIVDRTEALGREVSRRVDGAFINGAGPR